METNARQVDPEADEREAELIMELNRFCVAGGAQRMREIDCVQFADRALDACSTIADDARCNRIVAEAVRVAYNRGILLALDAIVTRRSVAIVDPKTMLADLADTVRRGMVPG